MGLDKHTCGDCNATFTDLQLFINHKSIGCNAQMNQVQKDVEDEQVDAVESASSTLNTESVETSQAGDICVSNEISEDALAHIHGIIINDTGNFILDVSDSVKDVQLNSDPLLVQPAVHVETKKKRGRPRKAKESQKPSSEIIPTPAPHKDGDQPEILENGKIKCRKCRKTFIKERHFKTHRCLAFIDYVDISKSEVISDSGDDETAYDEQTVGDNFEFQPNVRFPPKNDRRFNQHVSMDTSDSVEVTENSREEGNVISMSSNPTVTIELSNDLETLAEDQATLLEKSLTPRVSDTPVFPSENDKREFIDSLNVDVGSLDHMFRTHKIEQVLNDTSVHSSRGSNELVIYSCNTCNKVFKSQSHIRHHCLTHTNLKPFRCSKCPYTSNSKGNLYTHMRKHTGQFYYCKSCDFKSVNRSHVVDHESIHSADRHKCEICQNDYNTLKSLINHIRKYHTSNEQGVEYLRQFLSRQTAGSVGAVLHQCHVCNRKFKKRIDRDRHLFVHKVSAAAHTAFKCEICDFSSNRRCYLEYHMQKHRIVYCCAICGLRFVSTVQLSQHLAEYHFNKNCPQPSTETDRDTLFDACIGVSLFLPEPDGKIDQLLDKNASSDGNYVLAVANKQLLTEVSAANEPKMSHRTLDPNVISSDRSCLDDKTPMVSNDNNAEQLQYHTLNTVLLKSIKDTFGSSECQYCGRLFHTARDLEPHILTHTADKPYMCDKCDYRAVSVEAMKTHAEKFHEHVQYSCTEEACSFVAVGRYQLWAHLQKHKDKTEAACPVCHTFFTDYQKLNIHIKMQHPNFTIVAEESDEKTVGMNKCCNCDRLFTVTEYQKHVCTHKQQQRRQFKCQLCTHTCHSISNLKTHMLRHYNTKPFVCEFCDKKYKSKTALRWHVRSHKNGGRIFKCTKCPYTAEQKSQLTKHLTRHEVLKRYKCEKCEFSSNALGALKTHCIRYHNPTVSAASTTAAATGGSYSSYKLFKCMSCDCLFENVELIQQHLRDDHMLDVQGLGVLEQNGNANSEEFLQSRIVQDNNTTEVQVVQLNTEDNEPTMEDSRVLETLQFADGEMDEKTVSAVSILQQIIDMSQQGILGAQPGQSILPEEDSSGGQPVQPEDGGVYVQPTAQFVIQCSGSEEAAELLKQVQQVMTSVTANAVVTQQSTDSAL